MPRTDTEEDLERDPGPYWTWEDVSREREAMLRNGKIVEYQTPHGIVSIMPIPKEYEKTHK